MNRYAKERRNPPVKPVRRVEVSNETPKWKWFLIVGLLAVGVTLIAVALTEMLTTDPGWQTISVNTQEANCGDEFVFSYYLGAGEESVAVETKRVSGVYTDAAVQAYRLFHGEEGFEGIHNVYYLNNHIGEAVEVDASLYHALSLLKDNRYLYLAPIYREYRGMFLCEDDFYAESYDPVKNSEQGTYFREILYYVNQPEMISLELLGNNTVRLNVAQEYLNFAKENEIQTFVDFYWMKNAFIADYLANALLEKGFTKGTISSYDGFTRNLDSSQEKYKFNLFHRQDKDIYAAAVMEYQNVSAIVNLRTYPMNNLEKLNYYTWQDGTTTTPYIDVADGISKTALSDIVAYSQTAQCGEILAKLMPLYIRERVEEDELATLRDADIHYVYFREFQLCSSDKTVTFSDFYKKDGIEFALQ